MIRYHEVTHINGQIYPMSARGDQYLVTARRKPRGYILRAKQTVHTTKIESPFKASYTCHTVEGWRPMGLDGYTEPGLIFHTREKAAKYLLSCHRFFPKETA